jgi:hypothetical protein
MTVRSHLDQQLDILQRLNEGEVTVDLIAEAIHHNNRASFLLDRSREVTEKVTTSVPFVDDLYGNVTHHTVTNHKARVVLDG